MLTRQELGVRLHTERFRRGWSLAQLAARTGISETSLSRYERGKRWPSTGHLLSLAEALEVRAETFLEDASRVKLYSPTSGLAA